jgi:NAD(P)-dependent dehydrogenase (short-subunit alcohol dehydrogenase family)
MIDNLLDYDPPADVLKHKRILITGAADGIGRAVSMRFASHGASLILLDKKTRKLETLYDDIVAAGGPEPALVVQDLVNLDHESALKIGIGIEQDFQGLDGLLHNAGQLYGLTPMHSIDNDARQQTLQINLIAPWILTQVMLPLMKRCAAASILFTSAHSGRRGQAYWGAYAVAYGGIEMLAQTWADEVEQNTAIRINTIDPGPVQTSMRRLSYPGEVSGTVRGPAEITAAYVYLMADDSKHVRGQALTI